MQDAFQALVEPLRNLNYNALDVSAPAWFDDFQRFSFGVKDLDLLLCNVIEGAFESTAGVLAQLELTEAGPRDPVLCPCCANCILVPRACVHCIVSTKEARESDMAAHASMGVHRSPWLAEGMAA